MKFKINRTRTSLLFIILTAITLSALSVSAQNPNANPLLKMLALVPQSAADPGEFGSIVSYVDYRAIEASRGVSFTSDAAFEAASDEEVRLWLNATMRALSGPPELLTYLRIQLEEMRELVGFDRLAIDHALTYGTPPGQVQILAVEVDAGAVNAALSARDFEQRDVNGVTVWHRFEDYSVNIRENNPADPFGGPIGKASRIALLPGYVAEASAWPLIESVLSTTSGDAPSLLDDPDYAAAAEAITDANAFTGTLVQAQFIDPYGTAAPNMLPMIERMTPEQAEAFLQMVRERLASMAPLPDYNLAVLADRDDNGEQLVIAALVYDNAADAETAAQVLSQRLVEFIPFSRNIDTPFAEEVGAVADPPRVYESADGRFVAVAALRYPMPSTEEVPDSGLIPPPGRLFRMWVQALIQREFTPLVVSMILE